jgi:membrane fusion protein, copper/silver efflux system
MTESSNHVEPPAGVRGMAVVRWALVGLMAIIAAGSLLSVFGARHAGDSSAKATIYYCPMHPQIQQDHPGDCPICSMTLVPKPTGPAAAAKSPASPGTAAPPGLVPVDIPQDRVQKIGIRTAIATRQAMGGGFRTAGGVQADERGLANISPRFSGWIETLEVSETGQRVKRGQALATVYSPEVLQAQQELLTALGWSDTGSGAQPHHAGPLEGLVGDARRRLELLGISPQEVDTIIKTRKPQRAIAIRSPVDGHVITKNAVVGMSVSPGVPLFEVANLATVWVVAEVYESDLKRIQVGQTARFESSAYPGETFIGKVKFVHPTLDPQSRTLRVRLEFRNRPGPAGLKLRPGMYGDVLLDLPAADGLMVPTEALVDTGDMQYVFVAKPEGRFEPRRVRSGARQDDRVEIVEGLTEGEKVVTTANFLIDSESRLHAAIGGQAAPAPASDARAPAATAPAATPPANPPPHRH